MTRAVIKRRNFEDQVIILERRVDALERDRRDAALALFHAAAVLDGVIEVDTAGTAPLKEAAEHARYFARKLSDG